MSMRAPILSALFAAALAAPGLAAPASAQTSPAPATTATAASNAATRRDATVERRIAALHSKLNITAAEQKPFDDFAQAMRDSAAAMDEAMAKRRAAGTAETAVEQMKGYAEVAQAHAQQVSQLVGPFSTLYDALSPQQKKLADQSFRDYGNQERMARTTGG